MKTSWQKPAVRSMPIRPGIRLMPPSAADIHRWLNNGQVEYLEKSLLDGYGFMLDNRKGLNSKSNDFMKEFVEYKEKVDQFLQACVAGDLDKVRSSCHHKNAVEARHPATGSTGLHLSIIWAQYHVAAYLATTFADLCEMLDNHNRLPIHYLGAIIYANTPNALLDDDEIRNELPSSYMESTFLGRLYETLKGQHRTLDTTVDADGYTAAQYALGKRHMDITDLRKQNQYPIAKADIIDSWVTLADYDQLERLVLDGHGPEVLNRFFPPGSEEVERRLHICVRRTGAIQKSIVDGDDRAFKQLLDRKKYVLARDAQGATPLHTAVKYGRESMADYLLLIHPFCVNAVDQEQRTALHIACLLENPKQRDLFRERLLHAAADPDLLDIHGYKAEDYLNLAGKFRTIGDTPVKIYSPIFEEENYHQLSFDSLPDSEMAHLTNGVDGTSPEPPHCDIQKWLDEGNFDRLEQLVVLGKASLLDRFAEHYQSVASFLDNVQKNQAKVEKIHEAIKEGSLRKVKNLIDRKKLVLTRAVDGQNALGLAVVLRQRVIVEYLCTSYPESINLKDKDKRTPLHYAAILTDQWFYNKLVAAGGDEETRDKIGHSPKYYRQNPKAMETENQTVASASALAEQERLFQEMDAATAPSPDQIQRWLADGNVDELEQIVLSGRSHLLLGRQSDNVATEEFLGALPRYQAKVDAIHKAVEEGDVRRVKSLIDRPSLAMARDRKGATPVHNAVLHGQTDTLKYLLNKFPEAVNATDHVGRSPLHYAAADKNGSVYVKMLQKAGADAFVMDKLAHTPFYYRTNPEQLNLIKLKDDAVMDQLMSGDVPSILLQDLEEEISEWLQTGNLGKLEELVLNGYGDLLLGKAHEVEDKDVLSFLEVLPQYQSKIQAIHRAIESDNIREVKALMDRKKLALARDRKGATPLHKAVLYNHINITGWLLKNYPQAVNALDHSKRTPLHYAASMCNYDAGYSYKMLRKAGADANIPDGDAKTPKHYLNFPQELNIEALREECRAATKSVMQQRIAPSYLDTSIQQWLREGNVAKLEQLTLSGCGDLLMGRSGSHPEASDFLSNLDEYLMKINDLHKSVREGDSRALKQILEKKKLVLARDRKGATPLHNAILYQQTELVRYLAQSFPQTLNAPDYNKRTPLHYAAACRDGGHYYKILEKAGADPSAVDNEGKTPDVYRRNAGLLDLRVILERDRDLVPEVNVVRSGSADSMARTDSRVSELSAMTPESTFRDNIGDLLADVQGEDGYANAVNEAVMSPTVRNQWLHRMPPTSANGRYLATAVGGPLTKALAEVLIKRPIDPIAFLSDWLLNYHQQQSVRNGGQ